MAVTDKDIIDSISYEVENHLLIMHIYDHLGFEQEIEYDHMVMIQDKLNTYLWYLNSEQYKLVYPKVDFTGYRYKIIIVFLHDISNLCLDYLNHVREKLSSENIVIEWERENLKVNQ